MTPTVFRGALSLLLEPQPPGFIPGTLAPIPTPHQEPTLVINITKPNNLSQTQLSPNFLCPSLISFTSCPYLTAPFSKYDADSSSQASTLSYAGMSVSLTDTYPNSTHPPSWPAVNRKANRLEVRWEAHRTKVIRGRDRDVECERKKRKKGITGISTKITYQKMSSVLDMSLHLHCNNHIGVPLVTDAPLELT